MAQEIEKKLWNTEEAFRIAQRLKLEFGEDITDISEFRGQISVTVNKERVKEIIIHLKKEHGFNHLQDLCGVDHYPNKPRFEVVYNLYSIWRRVHIRLKAKIDEENLEIDSIADIWQGANWHERECYDMFGIRFNGHPDLRRILLPEDWDGYPLRKDYLIQGGQLWRGFTQIMEEQNK